MARGRNAGRYRHRAEVYVWQESDAASGGDDGAFAQGVGTVSELWGLLRPLRASEIERAQLNEAQGFFAFECRYVDTITAKMRLTINSKAYHVTGPPLDTDEQHREMKLLLRLAPA